MSSLSLEWTQHLPDNEKKTFTETVQNSTQVLSRLQEIVCSWEREIATEETLDGFESPSWSHLQAYRNGRKAEIRRLKQLFNFLG